MNKIIPTMQLKNINKSFIQGNERLDVLIDVDFDIMPQEIVALIGPSGSGKSTLLQIAGLLEKPDSGDIYIDGSLCSEMNDAFRTELRRDYLGFVYQYHNLLSDFTAKENVILPQLIKNISYKEAAEKAEWLLERLGLSERMNHRPAEMSGGEQQRVAIARAIANTPKLLLADEPTGNLDPETSDNVFSELLKIVKETNLCALIATHNMDLAKKMDRKVQLKSGHLVDTGFMGFLNHNNFY